MRRRFVGKKLILLGAAAVFTLGFSTAVYADAPEGAEDPEKTEFHSTADGTEKEGFHENEGEKDTPVVTGQKEGSITEIDGKKYFYFDDHTLLEKANVVIDGYGYRADGDGVLSTRAGWLDVGEDWYYTTADGKICTGIAVQTKNQNYYIGDDGKMVRNCVIMLEGKYYYAGEDGAFVKDSGWISYDGKWYYSGETVELLQDQVIHVKGGYYYLGADAVMVKNTFVQAGTSLYYATKSGAFYTKPGWFWNGGKWYFLETGVTFARNSFIKSQGKTYYMDDDGSLMKNSFIYTENGIFYAVPGGVVRTKQGWRQIGDDWYYFSEGGALVQCKIVTSKGKKYYIDSEGKMVTDSQVIGDDGYAYKADNSGVLSIATGWIKEGDNWYRTNGKGKVYKDQFVTVSGVKYYFDEFGVMFSGGFFHVDSKMYYANSKGKVRTTKGWMKYDGNWYYSDAEGVFYRSVKLNIKGTDYYFNAKGIWSEEGVYEYYTGIINDTSYAMVNGRRYHMDENDNPDSWFGIDVSAWNGDIDWEAVAADGVDFAIVRAGGRFSESGGLYDDSKLAANVIGATNAGIPVGVYFFTQAITVEEAIEEAEYTINAIKGLNVELPIVIDTEHKSGGRHNNLTRQQRTDIVKAFCETVEKAGYRAMYYAGMAWCEDDLDTTQLAYMHWCAQWWLRNQCDDIGIPYQVWQYSDVGRINGIKGNVDINIWYRHQTTEE